MPHPPTLSHGKGRRGKGLKTTINQGIITKKLTKKKPHRSSLLEKMGGANNYKK
jgi:hypothetical protein